MAVNSRTRIHGAMMPQAGAGVAGCYDRPMRGYRAAGAYGASVTSAGVLRIVPAEGGAGPEFMLARSSGELPSGPLHDPQLEAVAGTGRWRLACREGNFEFTSAGLEVQQPLPGLFEPMLAGFALRKRDRRVVRWLLRLLRLPGGARLLSAWHARRGR
jgi:hypothetical protein